MLCRIAGSCWLSLFIVVSIGTLHADIIRFKDGTELHGQIVAKTDDFVMIKFADGTKKVSADSIQEVLEDMSPETSDDKQKKRLNIHTIKKLSISDIQADLDAWLKALRPLRRTQSEMMLNAKVAARMREREKLYFWLKIWYKKDRFVVSFDDITDLRTILKECLRFLADDINTSQQGKTTCGKCHGTGKIIVERKIHSSGRGKINVAKTWKLMTCQMCRGMRKSVSTATQGALERIKKLGGLKNAIEIESAIGKFAGTMPSLVRKARDGTIGTAQLKAMAKEAHAQQYYYITLEILRLCEEKKK